MATDRGRFPPPVPRGERGPGGAPGLDRVELDDAGRMEIGAFDPLVEHPDRPPSVMSAPPPTGPPPDPRGLGAPAAGDFGTGTVGWRMPDSMAMARRRSGPGRPVPAAPDRGLGVVRVELLLVAGLGLVLLLATGFLGWYLTRSEGGDEITTGPGPESTLPEEEGEDGATLASALLPEADEQGLVVLDLPLIDPYTGTGSTGTVQLYLNSLSGQVCHEFQAPAMAGRYRAYLHQAPYPLEGPVVVDLGEVANSIPRCVVSNPIDLVRVLTNAEDYYIAAHRDDRTFLMRGQMSTADVVLDNRDPDTVSSQEVAAAATETTVGDGSAGDLFGVPDEGAYLVVDAGRVSFEGAVPDSATADRLRAAFVPLLGRGVEATDNLEIQPGAPAPSGKLVIAGALLFDTGRDQLKSNPEVLDTLVDLMTVNPDWTMTITGHTDDVGGWLTNVELSLRRAGNVRNRLVQLGIPSERIRIQGAGPEQPIADNETEESRARNRRIEISIDS